MIGRNKFPAAFGALGALTLLLAGPPCGSASAAAPNQDLKACLTLAETQPEAALERARAWDAAGGGTPARLCQGLALFHRGDFAESGRILEALAMAVEREDGRGKAAILGRAGWAWLRAGDSGRAERLYSAALELQPGDADLLVDRAIARAEGERFWDALADLDAVLAKESGRADAWLYRAAAHKALGNTRQALADVAQALELRPGDPEALLLRGNLKLATGDAQGAREDWKLVLRLAPNGGPGRAARGNLDGLDRAEAEAGPKGGPAPQAEPQPQPQSPKAAQ